MSLLAFVIAAVVLAMTSGPGIAYVVARTVAGGRAEGLASCLGTALGGLVHVLAAALGISWFVAQSAWGFSLLKYAGVAYLVYLGIRTLRHQVHADDATVPVLQAQGVRHAFRDGVLVEALNVKTALFFLAFLPQFTTLDLPMVPQLIMLGCISVGLNTLVDVLAVLGASKFLQSSKARIARAALLKRFSGCTMVALGVLLATAKRSS